MASKSRKPSKGSKAISFLSGSPIGADLLEGQAQEHTAERIAHLFRSDDTKNRLFGLDGAWGSGKSNLIRILESKLSKTHHFFVYDAWGHQEDLHRRTFLEELTADLRENKVIDADEWKQRLKDLLSRKRETLTRTIPRLSNGVILSAIVLGLMPFAQTLAAMAEDAVCKIAIAASPMLFGLILYVVASVRKGECLSLREIYSIYKEDQLTNETHETVFEDEPSVTQFQGWMRDLSKGLRKKRLIVVFDNMDRLPPDKVRELWSSIHTFFVEEAYEGIQVIVPFDRKHMSMAFDEAENQNETNLAEEFLSKSFSVIFRVAPPVLTDWQKFFDLKFREAFGRTEESEKQLVRRIFNRLQRHITPRSIIAFINELVALRITAGTDIALKYMAVFVLRNKPILEDPVTQILNNEWAGAASPLFSSDPSLADNIAALVYHVPIESASQVTLTGEIENAFTEQDFDRFKLLAGHNHFIDILGQVVNRDATRVEEATATIASLENEDLSEDIVNGLPSVWNDLAEKELMSSIEEQLFTRTHELLLPRISTEMQSKLTQHLAIGFARVQSEKFAGDKYYGAVSSLRDCIAENGLSVDLSLSLQELQLTAKNFIEFVRAAGDENDKLKVNCDESELQQYLIERIPDGLDDTAHLSLLVSDFDFEPVIQHMLPILQERSLTQENVGPFYELYKAISKDKPIKMPDPQDVATLLPGTTDQSSAQYDLIAMRLAMHSGFPDPGGISQSVLNETDDDLVENIASRIEYFETYGQLLLNHIDWPQPIMKAVLERLTVQDYGESKAIIFDVLEKYKALQDLLGLEPQVFAYSTQCSHSVQLKVAGCSKAKWPRIPVGGGQPSERRDAVVTL